MEKLHITLAAARVNANLTQVELAAELGVHTSTIKNWESGKTSPESKYLRRIGELSGIPMDYIFLPDNLPKVEKPSQVS